MPRFDDLYDLPKPSYPGPIKYLDAPVHGVWYKFECLNPKPTRGDFDWAKDLVFDIILKKWNSHTDTFEYWRESNTKLCFSSNETNTTERVWFIDAKHDSKYLSNHQKVVAFCVMPPADQLILRTVGLNSMLLQPPTDFSNS